MSKTHEQHSGTHSHVHGPNCGHIAVKHDGHTDYLHDGHLHYAHGDHVDDHKIEVTAANPEKCTPNHSSAPSAQQSLRRSRQAGSRHRHAIALWPNG
jgi:hypothetical protein